MAFLVRSLHVGSASFVLGGAILLIIVFYLSRSDSLSTSVMLKLMQAYEWGFWAAMGLIVATGIGNVAYLGAAIPGAESEWGMKFLAKLGLFAALLLLSAVRVMVIQLVKGAASVPVPARVSTLQGLYVATTALTVGVGGLAVSMVHF